MDRLILMRHGKAERDSKSGEDFDRKLTDRGVRESAAMAANLADLGLVPDIALVSAAQRTRETWAAAQGAFQQNQWWWYLPPGLCIAAIGVALSLINFGIDEYVNPRLRSAGERARALRKQGINANSAVTAVRPVAMKKEDNK